MVKGIAISTSKVYDATGRLVMESHAGDRVEADTLPIGAKAKITRLIRNGKIMSISYPAYIESLSVKWDAVTQPTPTEPPPPPVPGTKILAYVYTQRERAFYEYRGGNIPDTRAIETIAAKYGGRVRLTKELQKMIFEVNFSRVPGMPREQAVKEFVYILNDKLFICNDAGSDSRRVYINYLNNGQDIPGLIENVDRPDPEMNQLCMPGVVELLDGKIYKLPRFDFQPRIAIRTINATAGDVLTQTITKSPYQWFRPSIIKWPQLNNGVFGSEPFDQFRARLVMPIMTNGINEAWVDPAILRPLRPGEVAPKVFNKDWSGL